MVLDALGQKAGPEDTRTAAQRRHDAIEEACRRLIGGQMIPGRDGQPPHLTVHIDLNDLRRQPGGSVLERSWTPALAAAGPGSVYLTGPAAEAAACDAVLTPMVTGQIDWAVLDQLTTVWLTAQTPPMCTATEPAAPASTGEALAMVRAGLGYLADCDAGSLGTAAQAEALIGLEAAEAQHTAARARILAAFTAQQGYEADGYCGAASWLRAITRVTKGAAAAATGWARRLDAHPVIAAALAAGQLPVSLARLICDWTDKLPEDLRADADGILLAAVLGGADQHDLARLGREMLDRAQTSPDRDSDGFEERALWLGTTFGGAGRLHADLTPACAAALTVVLEALGQKAGPEDTRTAAQRRHDAVEEACRRLIGGQLIPGRDGQPPHLTVHIDLNDLRRRVGAGTVLDPRAGRGRARVGVPDRAGRRGGRL